MSEQPIDPQPEPDADGVIHVDSPQAAPEPEQVDTADDVEVPQTLEAARKLRSENRSLRQRLHAAEAANAELEGAATRLSALEHAEVERIAAQDLIDGSDVWTAQPDLTAFYDEEFKQVVPDRVREATQALIASKPHLARPNTTPPPSKQPLEGLRPGATPNEPKPKAHSWSSALRGTGL